MSRTVSPTVSPTGARPADRAPGAPLGPGSLLWRIAGDWRSVLSGTAAGILQLAWPDLGQSVADHSAFFTEPWDRIHRSVPRIWATILGDEPEARGRAIRDEHRGIGGTRPDGGRYHALYPDTFWWAHATFTWEMFETADRWDRRTLSAAHREQLYQETVTWYRRYGVSDRPVPCAEAAFRRRFDAICAEHLELTPTASRAIDMALDGRIDAPGPAAGLLGPVLRTVTLGGLPPVVRERFGIPWSAADQAALDAVTATVRVAGATIPHRLTRGPYLASIRRMKHLAAPHPDRTPVATAR